MIAVCQNWWWKGGLVLVWADISLDGRTYPYIVRNGALASVNYRYEVLDPIFPVRLTLQNSRQFQIERICRRQFQI